MHIINMDKTQGNYKNRPKLLLPQDKNQLDTK